MRTPVRDVRIAVRVLFSICARIGTVAGICTANLAFQRNQDSRRRLGGEEEEARRRRGGGGDSEARRRRRGWVRTVVAAVALGLEPSHTDRDGRAIMFSLQEMGETRLR